MRRIEREWFVFALFGGFRDRRRNEANSPIAPSSCSRLRIDRFARLSPHRNPDRQPTV